MRIIVITLCFLLLSLPSAASTLIFKGIKDIDSKDAFVELTTFDASKFGQIRISIANISSEKQDGYFVGRDYFDLTAEFLVADDPLDLHYFGSASSNRWINTVIKVPPHKIQIRMRGQGRIRTYVWGHL